MRPRRQLHPAERRQRILRFIQERGSRSVAAVVEEFGVSETTARRDLRILAADAHVTRTYGGAVLPDLGASREAFDVRLEKDAGDKLRLAQAVVAEIQPDETLFLDSTSTAYFVLREILRTGVAVTVATNSLAAMAAVSESDSPNVGLIALGGTYRRGNRSFVGAETLREIDRMVVDRLVFSVKGVEASGLLTDPHPLEADVKRAMVERARSVVLVADAHKFDARGLHLVARADDVDVAFLVRPPVEADAAFARAGVDVRRI